MADASSIRNSTFRVYPLPVLGTATADTLPRIATSASVPTRVMVKANADIALVAYQSQSLLELSSGAPAGDFFIIAPFTSPVFILAPGQTMFAISPASFGVSISVAQSDAFPINLKRLRRVA